MAALKAMRMRAPGQASVAFFLGDGLDGPWPAQLTGGTVGPTSQEVNSPVPGQTNSEEPILPLSVMPETPALACWVWSAAVGIGRLLTMRTCWMGSNLPSMREVASQAAISPVPATLSPQAEGAK